MSFSDLPFGDGPFVTHDVPCEYLKNYFSTHKLNHLLVLNTTVEDVSKHPESIKGKERWNLTLKRYDQERKVDEWWEEEYDAVIFGNGHYSVPFVSPPTNFVKYLVLFMLG
jgi:cation diffusion facilitator CzcD-associated flavoprotein CzcO